MCEQTVSMMHVCSLNIHTKQYNYRSTQFGEVLDSFIHLSIYILLFPPKGLKCSHNKKEMTKENDNLSWAEQSSIVGSS